MTDAGYVERIDALYEQYRRDRAAFDPPDRPRPERAMAYLRDGAGPAVALYTAARTGGPPVPIQPAALDRLEAAMNGWLELYARCHGVELTADFPLRVAAEALIDTHDIGDVARVLTKVPARGSAP